MPLDPTERNVNPFLFQTGIRTVSKRVRALTIHDENITMIKPARASVNVQTRPALPFEERMGTTVMLGSVAPLEPSSTPMLTWPDLDRMQRTCCC